MSNPQKENGYTAIANEIMDQLIKTPIGKSDSQILFAIIRKTYGWNKKSDNISISQLMEMTECSRRAVIYAIQNLEAKRMILVVRKRGRGNINEVNHISFNKKYLEWVVQEKSSQYNKVLKSRKDLYKKSKERVVQEIEGSARNGQKVVQEMVNNGRFLAPTKDTITKDITKDITSPEKDEGEIYKTKKNQKLSGKRLESFNKFMDCFEYKKGKASAADAWFDIKELTDRLVNQIYEAAKKEAKNRPALIQAGKTPIYPQGWITGRRWEDEEYKPKQDKPHLPDADDVMRKMYND